MTVQHKYYADMSVAFIDHTWYNFEIEVNATHELSEEEISELAWLKLAQIFNIEHAWLAHYEEVLECPRCHAECRGDETIKDHNMCVDCFHSIDGEENVE